MSFLGIQDWLDARAARKMAAKTAAWPTTLAKLHEWEINPDGVALTFAYSYEVGGEFYSGEGRLPCHDVAEAERRAEALDAAGQFAVRYAPDDASRSWLDPQELRTLTGT